MKRHLDAMVGGSFLKKSGTKDTFELLKELTKSEAAEGDSRVRKSVRVHDKTSVLEAEIDKLCMEIKAMKIDNTKGTSQ